MPTRAVTIELSQSRIEDIDPQGTVEFFRSRSFNTLVVFALGYLHGETYYPSAHAPTREGLGDRDVFGEFVSEATRAGLRVVAYVNSFFGGPDAWEVNPAWTQRWVDGTETTQGMAKGLCINSPYGRRIIEVCGEVADLYPIDGLYLDEPSLQSWCACEACCSRYLAERGRELPRSAAPGDPDFAAFLRWRTEVVAEFVARAGAAARAARPSLSFIAQHAFPLASTSDDQFRHLFWGRTSGRRPPQFEGWYRPSFYGQDIRLVGHGLDVVAIEPWRRFVGTPAWWVGATVAYARAAGGGKPVLPLMEYPHFPWGLSRLSDDELRVGCADVVANGGELWWPMYAPGQADATGWETLRQVFADLDGARPVTAMEAAETAVLVSRRTAEQYGMGDVDRRYLDHVIGALRLLRDVGRPHRLLSAEAMTAEGIANLRTIVAPSAACLDDREATLLADWVAAGGHLLTIGPTATHDESGRRRPAGLLDDTLGITQIDETVAAGLGYLVNLPGGADGPQRLPARDDQCSLRVTTADVRYELVSMWDLFEPPPDVVGVPSVTRNRWHEGVADHVAIGLGRLRYRYELFEAAELLQQLLGASEPTVDGIGLGPDVGIHVWRNEGQIRVFLVNHTSLDGTGRSARLGEQRVLVPTGLVSSHRGTALRTEPVGPSQVVVLPHLDDWDCLVVEPS